MKIGLIIDNPVHVGGGFHQAMNAVAQMKRICADLHQVVIFTTIPNNISSMRQLGFDVASASPTGFNVVGRILRAVARRIGLAQLALKYEASTIERVLIQNDVQLAYFTTSSRIPGLFGSLNFITTAFDLFHLDMPEFPEIRSKGQFLEREAYFSTCVPQAAIVLAGSKWVAKKIEKYYKVDEHRVIYMPFEPSPFLSLGNVVALDVVLKKYNIKPGYYFYPAQMWPHKNHIILIEAIALLVKQKGAEVDFRLVFCGGDKGNSDWIKNAVKRLGLSDRVYFLGFVQPEELKALYEGALAVVMPTYLGPTNIPPLEAWMMKRPLIYSAHLPEQVADAALMADADDAESWAEAMWAVRDPKVAEKLVISGERQLGLIQNERLQAESELVLKIDQFARRRLCWE